MFLSMIFQFIIAEKCYVQKKHPSVTLWQWAHVYVIAEILSSCVL